MSFKEQVAADIAAATGVPVSEPQENKPSA